MTYNDLSSCNCCPTVDPCTCSGHAIPCCWSMTGFTHCGFVPSGDLCRGALREFQTKTSRPISVCHWLSDATYVLMKADPVNELFPQAGAGGRFPTVYAVYWLLEFFDTLVGSGTSAYQLKLVVAQYGNSNTLTDVLNRPIARWLPEDPYYDPMFNTGGTEFNFDRLLEAGDDYPSIVNCQYPSGCSSSQVADGTNLPQTIQLTPSCFVSTDPCESACEESNPNTEIGCEECSSNPMCPDGGLPANCTWEWDSMAGLWSVTSDDCSNSPTSSCSCVPMLDGCQTTGPSGGEASLIFGPCYVATNFTEGVQGCDP